MSEITDMTEKIVGALSPAARKFVIHWGELGTRWGINRTVAQIHALLYLSPEPLDVAAICETLEVARSNASTSLRELRGWGVVRSVHLIGDRREHFEAVTDVWQMFSILVEARKRREIDPTLAILRECAIELDARDEPSDRHIKTRIKAMLELFETLTPLIDEFLRLPIAAIRGVAGLRGSLQSLLKRGAK
ncbi:MAG: transcriptional regulatory protein [Candidatus Eremiobacteraeota bacterium]|jgi:DNA-binding transcriptional regulator GbsR (MarR family)|nr:transcriptional regulatory protein [Candidatus Eremiobacteraeota bacterium]